MGKKCTFLLADLWLRYFYDMTVCIVGNINQHRKIVFDLPVMCHARVRFQFGFLINHRKLIVQTFKFLNHLKDIGFSLILWKSQPKRTKAVRVMSI